MAKLAGPSIYSLVGDMTGPTMWRVLFPFTALEKAGYRCGWDFQHNRLAEKIAPTFDGYLLPRMSWAAEHRPIAAGWIAQVKAAGKLIIFDSDDDLFSPAYVERHLAVYPDDPRTVGELERERADRLWVLSQADGVTVSTSYLADVVRGFTERPVIVVPNAIDIPWFRTVLRATTRQIQAVTVGWAGGRRDDADVEPMAAAWGRIADRFPAVRFVVQGYVPPIIRASVPADRLVVIPWLPLEKYPAGLKEVDIACCSVADTPFNRSKSNIKALEAAVAGSAVVATPTLYGSLIVDGHTGRLAESVEEWETAIATYVASHATRKQEARRLLRFVERRCSLAENLYRWPLAWQTIANAAAARRLVAV